jgi:hypothetical protein
VSVYETLTEHKDEYIFYNTDHHWTTYGAYLGYVEFCKAAGLTPLEYSAEKVSDSFNGTLYSKSGVRFFSSDSMERFNIKFDTTCTVVTSKDQGVTNDSVYYEENLQIKDKYTYYLGDNMAVVTARANNGNNKKLLVIKDSYAHCMAPMLLAHYDEVTFVDQRYIKFDLSYYTDPSLYDDLLILFSVDGFGQNDLKALSVYINEETK